MPGTGRTPPGTGPQGWSNNATAALSTETLETENTNTGKLRIIYAMKTLEPCDHATLKFAKTSISEQQLQKICQCCISRQFFLSC